MKTIFLYEWKMISRSPVSLLLLFFFLASGLYSIHYGTRIIHMQHDTIDSLQTAYDTQLRSSVEKFKADTSTRQGKTDYSNVSSPASVNYRIKPSAIFYPNAFSVLAIGQRDVLPFHKEISTERSFTQTYEPDISNPQVLAEGNFDLSFVIIYLMPLFMIALSYNVISREMENGTFLLLCSQNNRPDRILLYKLLFRVLFIGLLTFVINGAAIYRASRIMPITISDLFCWMLVVSCYFLFWFAVCYLIVSFRKASVITAFYLAGCWLLLTIVFPFFLNLYVDMAHPLVIRADMASEQRKIEEDVWSIKPKELIWNFYRLHPEYKTGNLADTFQYSPRRFAAYYDELERRLLPIARIYTDRTDQRNALMHTLSDFIPALKTQKMLNQIGLSDLKSFNEFDRSTLVFQQQWQAFIYRFIFNDKDLQEKDYRKFPAYGCQRITAEYRELIIGALQLCMAAFFLIATRFYIANKFNNINNS